MDFAKKKNYEGKTGEKKGENFLKKTSHLLQSISRYSKYSIVKLYLPPTFPKKNFPHFLYESKQEKMKSIRIFFSLPKI